MLIQIGMDVWVEDPDDPSTDGYNHAFQGHVVGLPRPVDETGKHVEDLVTVEDQDGTVLDVPARKVREIEGHLRAGEEIADERLLQAGEAASYCILYQIRGAMPPDSSVGM